MTTDFYGNLGISFLKLGIVAEECTQSFRELQATYDAIKNRYHPLVWMFIRIYWFFRQ